MGNTRQDLVHGFLPCYLTAFNVNYNNESRTFYERNGRYDFTMYEITLSFQEIRALSQSDIEDGF